MSFDSGGGRGRGRGRGRGWGGGGRGRGRCQRPAVYTSVGHLLGVVAAPWLEKLGRSTEPRDEPPTVDDELLRARADAMEAQLREFRERLAADDLNRGGQLVAAVDASACSSCGECLEVCPMDALSMEGTASVDGQKCAGCGICLDLCPTGALSLRPVSGDDSEPQK